MTECFNIFAKCVEAMRDGELIESVSSGDKEFHFQNWFQKRLESLNIHYEGSGRNRYPDFKIVEVAEGYEVKGLAWPGRERDYDANSQMPTGRHNGREIFYVFGRYPADLSAYDGTDGGNKHYPVVDLIMCHGNFLNADCEYVHKNKSVKGFGTYCDIIIRDRKMYVAPTPFALTEGTVGLATLIVPEHYVPDDRFINVGAMVRTECRSMVKEYSFDLSTNKITTGRSVNRHSGREHRFVAYRLKGQSEKNVRISNSEIRYTGSYDEDEYVE